MSGYIRSGNRNVNNLLARQSIEKAAKRIQKKIKDGFYTDPKARIPDVVDKTLMEHLQKQLSNQSQVPKINVQGVDENGQTQDLTEIPKLEFNENLLQIAGINGKNSEGDSQFQIQYEIPNQNKNNPPKRFSLFFTQMPMKHSKNYYRRKTTAKNDLLENDIDTIQNYTQYFPHNNFSSIFPKHFMHAKTTLFDFGNEAGTVKATLKKFANIMRYRMSVKKEMMNMKFGSASNRSENKKQTQTFTEEMKRALPPAFRGQIVKDKRNSVFVSHARGDDADESKDNSSFSD